MPADLRIADLVTDPYHAEVGQPVAFLVNCHNVGDEGTGPFAVRFELDNQEYANFDTRGLGPGEDDWVRWPHDPLTEGAHHIYCLLDSTHAVPESEERHNQKSVHFQVTQPDRPPQDADGDEYYDDENLASLVAAGVIGRVNTWLGLAVQAVEEWGREAEGMVAAEYADVDATFDTAPVLFAFVQATAKHLPGVSTGMGVIEDAATLLGLVQGAMGNKHMTMADARAKLFAAIPEIQAATGAGLRQAIQGFDGRIRAHLSPDNDSSPLVNVEKGSLDPAYIGSLVTWLGFPEVDESNTTLPIKQEMVDAFEQVTWEVNRELQRAAGML
ncbi:MAG: hypothetical protein H0W25_21060 [Acidimicrobiia bacterium]|nr:hypothetical protein [Acidimicrobiia bacterium]